VFDGLEAAMEPWQKLPHVYAGLRSEYVALLLLAVNDAGQLMNAVADGNDTDTALAKVAVIPEDRRRAMLGLLTAIGYLRETNGRDSVDVPIIKRKR